MTFSSFRYWGALALAASIFSGCVTHRYAERPARPPLPRPAELVDYYTLDAEPECVLHEDVRRHTQFTLHRINLRSNLANADEEYDVGIEFFDPKTDDGPRPAILFLPILNEEPLVSHPFATYFANRGIAVAVVYTNERGNLLDESGEIEPNLQSMVIRQRLALDWLLRQPGIDPDRIGVMGISMGGIKAALLKGVDERVGPTVLGMAGGNIPFIALNSTDGSISRERETFFATSDLKLHEMVRAMRKRIRTDPLRVAHHVDPGEVLMFITTHDKVVPTRTQEALRTALGMPRTYYVKANHYNVLIHIFMVRHRAYRFFEEAFRRQEPLYEPARGLDVATR